MEILHMNPNSIIAIAMSVIAILQIILGALSLKAEPNHLLGLRLPWTMKNKKIWRVSQRIMFVTSCTTSIGILIVCATVQNNPVLILVLSMVLLLSNVIAVCVYTYSLSKKEEYNN